MSEKIPVRVATIAHEVQDSGDVVIFDEKSSLGLVRLRVKKASQELERTFEELLKKAEADRGNMANRFDSPFAEITDEDIDSLFSE